MSLRATIPTPRHRVPAPWPPAPAARLRDRAADADRSVRTMARAACSTYSVGVETDRAPELTGPFVDSDGDAAGTATALAATLRGAMHLAFEIGRAHV